jgi:hypothetical protein
MSLPPRLHHPTRSAGSGRSEAGATADVIDRWLRQPTAESADRWLHGLAAPTLSATHQPTRPPTSGERRMLRRAPRVVTGTDCRQPTGDRWLRFALPPATLSGARLGGRIPPPVTLHAPGPDGVLRRCAYYLVVVDHEVTLVPRNIEIDLLRVRVFGGREPHAPETVPAHYRPAYEVIRDTLATLQAEYDRQREAGAEG